MDSVSSDFALYIHIPFCVSKCDYCDFFSIPIGNTQIGDIYIESLLKELNYREKQFGKLRWKSVYIGGGTPSLLSSYQIQLLMGKIKENLLFNAEVTMEMNPSDISAEYLDDVAKAGINRISIGIQAMNDMALSYVNRRSNSTQIIHALDCLSSWRNFSNNRQISIDLMAGLLNQTYRQFKEGLLKALCYKPDHVSLYALTLEEKTPLYKKISKNDKKLKYIESKAANEWIEGCKILSEMNYEHYEVSNFALIEGVKLKAEEPSFHDSVINHRSHHNLAYWHSECYIGIGAGATGTVHPLRYTNCSDINLYCSFWKNKSATDEATGQYLLTVLPADVPETREILDYETQVFEYLMMGFRLYEGVSEKAFELRFGKSLKSRIGTVFSKWVEKDMACIKNGFYMLTEKGMPYLNIFLEELL